jgi:uncharacterized protein YbjT (DUF2867 family)
MRIVVLGGTGMVGRGLVRELTRRGHDAVPASRSCGVDVLTGAGLAEVLTGADVVVDVLNEQSRDPAATLAFFRGTAERIAAAETAAGVGRHVLLSIVGMERAADYPYYTAKLAQEAAAQATGARLTIVRATQFFDFARQVADWSTVDGQVHVTADTVQPVAVDDVVATLADLATAADPPDRLDLAGPDEYPLDEFVRATLGKLGDPRPVITEPGSFLGADTPTRVLVPAGDCRIGAVTWDSWIAATVAAAR